jgi:hypothetical protein
VLFAAPFPFRFSVFVDPADFTRKLLFQLQHLTEFPLRLHLRHLVAEEELLLSDLRFVVDSISAISAFCCSVSFWVGASFSRRSMASS